MSEKVKISQEDAQKKVSSLLEKYIDDGKLTQKENEYILEIPRADAAELAQDISGLDKATLDIVKQTDRAVTDAIALATAENHSKMLDKINDPDARKNSKFITRWQNPIGQKSTLSTQGQRTHTIMLGEKAGQETTVNGAMTHRIKANGPSKATKEASAAFFEGKFD